MAEGLAQLDWDVAWAKAEPPPCPTTLAETGLPPEQLSQLLLKHLYTGEAAGTLLADRLKLPYSVFENLMERARAEKLIEVRGASGTGTAGFRYALTELGRERTLQFLEANQYTGPAPVPLTSIRCSARIASTSGARIA